MELSASIRNIGNRINEKVIFLSRSIHGGGGGGTIKIGHFLEHQNVNLPYLDIDRRTRNACHTQKNEKKRENNVFCLLKKIEEKERDREREKERKTKGRT